MIQRLLTWFARWRTDSEWIRDMRKREVMANRSAQHLERRLRTGNVLQDEAFRGNGKASR